MRQVQTTQGQVVQPVQDQSAQTQSVQAQPTEVVQYVPVANNSPKQMVKNVVRSLAPVVQRGVQRIRAIPENMKQQLVNQINQSVVNYLKNTKFELCTTPNEPVTQQGGRRNYKKYNRTKKHRKSKKHKRTKHRNPNKHTKKRTRKRKY